ncbi:MAG: hypothetical protein IPL61_12930 [Myxococcales bacterium]|nr:hypothetical protein [Myxococcales bacterium]
MRAIIGEMSTRFRVPTNYLSSFKVFVVSCDEPATCRLASGPRQGATERVVVTLGPPADIAPGPALPVAATVLLMSVFAQSTRLELISPAGAVLGATGL